MQIDIYNEAYEHLGVADSKEVHAKGLWHRVFSCLVVTPRGTVLLQKKHSGLYNFERPDFVEPASASGHYHAGEAIEDGVREIEEELGLRVAYSDLLPLGVRKTAATISDSYIEREFQHLHLLPLALSLDELKLGNAETSGLVEINVRQGIELAAGELAEIPAMQLHWERNAPGGVINETVLRRNELVPSYLCGDELYLQLFRAARRFLNGKHNFD